MLPCDDSSKWWGFTCDHTLGNQYAFLQFSGSICSWKWLDDEFVGLFTFNVTMYRNVLEHLLPGFRLTALEVSAYHFLNDSFMKQSNHGNIIIEPPADEE